MRLGACELSMLLSLPTRLALKSVAGPYLRQIGDRTEDPWPGAPRLLTEVRKESPFHNPFQVYRQNVYLFVYG